jgi:transposase
MTKYVNIDRDTPLLLPPDLREWVPANHLIHFILEAVAGVPMPAGNPRGTGSAQYPPQMLLGLLIYCYASGVFASRRIERLSHENLAVRVLCANTHPDHDTICHFRRRNGALLQRAFAQVLELAARCGVPKVGDVTVAIDGTKILAHASKHAAVSYAHAGATMRTLDVEIAELLAKAETADATPLQDGLTIPAELARRRERQAQLAAARAAMEARNALPAEVAGPPPPPPDKAQYNFTDPESRIMHTHDGFQQCYNAQAAVDTQSRLIVGQRVCQAGNDKQELLPDLAALQVTPHTVLVDSGFANEAAIITAERAQPGLTILCALDRQRHGRTVAQLEQHPDPTAPPATAPFAKRMRHRTATAAGRARYQLRQSTVEPVFGIIKAVLGFRRFSLRGLANVATEWTLVTLAYNCRRLHRLRSA